MMFSIVATPCGPPKPRKAVLGGRFVRQTVPRISDVREEVGVVGVHHRARPRTDEREIGERAAVGEEVDLCAVITPSSSKPTL